MSSNVTTKSESEEISNSLGKYDVALKYFRNSVSRITSFLKINHHTTFQVTEFSSDNCDGL
jgi:hypothetical protein